MKRSIFKRAVCLLLILTLLVPLASCGKKEEDEVKEYFDTATANGKITVINFWGTWCPYCLVELPDFNAVAKAYIDEVKIIAVHSTTVGQQSAEDYIKESFSDSKIIFVKDTRKEGAKLDDFYEKLGGTGSYPYTVIVDSNGVITGTLRGMIDYTSLVNEIANAKEHAEGDLELDVRQEGNLVGDICPTAELKYINFDN